MAAIAALHIPNRGLFTKAGPVLLRKQTAAAGTVTMPALQDGRWSCLMPKMHEASVCSEHSGHRLSLAVARHGPSVIGGRLHWHVFESTVVEECQD